MTIRRSAIVAGVVGCVSAALYVFLPSPNDRDGFLDSQRQQQEQTEPSPSLIRDVKALQSSIRKELQQGNFDAALAACDRLAEIAPDDSLPWSVRGFVYEQRFESASAAEAYRQALQRKALGAEEIRHRLVSMLLASGRTRQARAELNTLLQQASDQTPYFLTEAILCRVEGKTAEAQAAIDRFLTRYPGNAPALMIRGSIRFEQQNYDGAIDDLSAAVEQAPNDYRAHYKLAQALERAGQIDVAEKHYAESQRLSPGR